MSRRCLPCSCPQPRRSSETGRDRHPLRPAACSSLEVLSLGRNNIKKIEGLDGVADTLKELWISYNNIEKMAGIEKLKSLEILYM